MAISFFRLSAHHKWAESLSSEAIANWHLLLPFLAFLLLSGCDATATDRSAASTSTERFAGKHAAALVYRQAQNGEFIFLCSGALVILEGASSKTPGVLTAAHCFNDTEPDDRGYSVALEKGGPFLKLSRAWVGDRFHGADISFAEIDATDSAGLSAAKPLVVSVQDSNITEGDDVWTWGNPDDKGIVLSVGYVMSKAFKNSVQGKLGQDEVSIDLDGYPVVDINTSPGSSGGLLLSKAGAVGVLSADFRHESGFKTAFITPIGRLKSVLSLPPSDEGPWKSPPSRKP